MRNAIILFLALIGGSVLLTLVTGLILNFYHRQISYKHRLREAEKKIRRLERRR